mmetsp:Transcript_10297/g.25157  ORF Transcript_10297/g.25157 Transcript_10297/m.25157 type:complete len:201 (-) Transcript_10297:16-618(-)
MPPMPIRARRPFLTSASAYFLAVTSFLEKLSGSNLKSPGARLPSRVSKSAMVPNTSRNESQSSSWPMAPCFTSTSCTPVILAPETTFSTPGKVKMSCAMEPAAASMAMRPCLSSASRRNLMSATSDMPRGSKPTSPTIEPSRAEGFLRKGTAADIACIFGPTAEVERVVEVTPSTAPGAKAEAVATAEAMRAERNMALLR